MFIQFEDDFFRRDFVLETKKGFLKDKDGELIFYTKNKGDAREDLKELFVGSFKHRVTGDKFGEHNKIFVQPRSRLKINNLKDFGEITRIPYPDPCIIFDLIVSMKELTNRDSRSRALTWFLNDCNGRPGYSGVEAQKTLDLLVSAKIVKVLALESSDKIHIVKTKFDDME